MDDFGLLVAQYNASLPTFTDGDYTELQVDVNGRLLVQADVTVLVDFLGLNGAGDSSNILIVGTEDGTSTGTPHVIQVGANGEITVTATDLDIRDLTHTQDSIAIGDGTDLLSVNADGSINVVATLGAVGSAAYTVTDALAAAGDGLVVITATATPWVTVASLAVPSGTTAVLFGYQWSCDDNAQVRIISDDTTDIKVYKTGLNSSATPGYSEHFSSNGRIEVAGATSLELKMQVKKRKAGGGDANGTGSMHLRTT